MSLRLSGLNPLSYMGVEPYSPPMLVIKTQNPTSQDYQNFNLGTIWINKAATPQNIYVLTSVAQNVATWQLIETSGGVGGFVKTLTSNTGGAISATAQNINVVGDGTTITGVGSGSTVTFSLIEDVATSFITSPTTGTAAPAAGVLTFAGAGDITVSASSHTVTITGSGTTGAVTGLKSQDANTVTPTTGVIQISGGNNLATTGTSGPNTLTISLSGITQHSVQIGGASNALTQLANGTTGQVLTAQTGADPIWAAGASFAWTDETSGTVAMAVNNGYTANKSTLTTLTLPSTAAYGAVLWIAGKGTGGWQIAQNAGQTIHFGAVNTTTGATGYLASTLQYDAVYLLCTTANTDFTVLFSIGNVTYN